MLKFGIVRFRWHTASQRSCCKGFVNKRCLAYQLKAKKHCRSIRKRSVGNIIFGSVSAVPTSRADSNAGEFFVCEVRICIAPRIGFKFHHRVRPTPLRSIHSGRTSVQVFQICWIFADFNPILLTRALQSGNPNLQKFRACSPAMI